MLSTPQFIYATQRSTCTITFNCVRQCCIFILPMKSQDVKILRDLTILLHKWLLSFQSFLISDHECLKLSLACLCKRWINVIVPSHVESTSVIDTNTMNKLGTKVISYQYTSVSIFGITWISNKYRLVTHQLFFITYLGLPIGLPYILSHNIKKGLLPGACTGS